MIVVLLPFRRENKVRFIHDREGAVLVIFTLFLFVLISVVGVGVDYARALVVKQRLINASDAAAIAIARQPSLTDAEITTVANAFIEAHYGSADFGHVTGRSITTETNGVSIRLTAQMETSILRAVGIGKMDIVAETDVVRGQRRLEVVLVLDNTGSMCVPSCAAKLDRLKEASFALTDQLFGPGEVSDAVKIGIVPFSGSVNVGTDKVSSGWIDTLGISPLHNEDIDLPGGRTLLDMYDELPHYAWNGCVRARVLGTGGYDVSDAPPVAGVAESLWVPYFAPDEPGPDASGFGYPNDYIFDDPSTGSPAEQQRNGNKYLGFADAGSYQIYDPFPFGGPNLNCVPQPVQALTNQKSAIIAAINGMQAAGATVIPSGLAWGWRVISPGIPFVEGAPYSDQGVIKAIILLTDGRNQVEMDFGHNKSYYSSYGYAAEGHLGATDGSQSQATLDAKTLTLCSNIKANHDSVADDEDIYLYTITFVDESVVGIDQAAAIRTMLQSCATPDAKCPGGKCYYDSPTGDDLQRAFANIAAGLSKLRIAR